MAEHLQGLGRSPVAIHGPDLWLNHPYVPAAAGGKEETDHLIGRSRGGLNTKINVAVDEARLPIVICLSASQATEKATLLDPPEALQLTRHVVADRGYDALAIVERI